MAKLTWATTQMVVNDLIPQETNPRTITDKQMSDLKRSLKKYNLVEIPAVDADGTLLAGHQRMKALQLLGRGDEVIDVRVPNRKLTKKESDQYLFASNKLGGDWDLDLLKTFSIDTLDIAGFDDVELSSLFDPDTSVTEESFDEEKELEKISKPKTKLGDLIQLGDHRVLCGDSTEPNNLKQLFGRDRASMIYSDPIYNIGLDYDKGVGNKQSYGGTVDDNKSASEYQGFIRKSLEAALPVTKKDTHIFYWCDEAWVWVFQTLYNEFGIKNRRLNLWLKNNASPTPTVAFSKVTEFCVYGTKGSPYLSQHLQDVTEVQNPELGTGNQLLEDLNNVWSAKRMNARDYEHATTKPPELHEKAIKRCTKVGDIILDSFLGSGSTLIAGEQLDRSVYGCELEPRFCDLIVKRYEKLTGNKAVYEKR